MASGRAQPLLLGAADGAVGVLGYRDFSYCCGEGVVGEEGVGEGGADGEEVFYGFDGLDGTDHPRECSDWA